MTNMNGVELAGRPMKVNNVTERDTTAMEALDGEDIDIGLGMTPAARAQLMAKLSDGHNAGLAVPQVSAVPTVSACFMLSNMFDPSRWALHCQLVCATSLVVLFAARMSLAGRMTSERMFWRSVPSMEPWCTSMWTSSHKAMCMPSV